LRRPSTKTLYLQRLFRASDPNSWELKQLERRHAAAQRELRELASRSGVVPLFGARHLNLSKSFSQKQGSMKLGVERDHEMARAVEVVA
jgi:hypothetical protein